MYCWHPSSLLKEPFPGLGCVLESSCWVSGSSPNTPLERLWWPGTPFLLAQGPTEEPVSPSLVGGTWGSGLEWDLNSEPGSVLLTTGFSPPKPTRATSLFSVEGPCLGYTIQRALAFRCATCPLRKPSYKLPPQSGRSGAGEMQTRQR